MRMVKTFIACSLDGYIARKDGSIDWLFSDGDYDYTEFYRSVDTVIMGRKTFELTRTFREFPYTGKDTYVISRTMAGNQIEGVSIIGSGVPSFIRSEKEKPGGVIYIVGGGELVRLCLGEHLLDEVIVSIHPLLLGGGIPLFPQGTPELLLDLVSCKSFDSGLVQLRYLVPDSLPGFGT